jgi:hypothetical protein
VVFHWNTLDPSDNIPSLFDKLYIISRLELELKLSEGDYLDPFSVYPTAADFFLEVDTRHAVISNQFSKVHNLTDGIPNHMYQSYLTPHKKKEE